MDDIGVSNDDTTAGLSLRRPSRAERAVDDPLREMEGMLVDEYGRSAIYFFLHIFLVLTFLVSCHSFDYWSLQEWFNLFGHDWFVRTARLYRIAMDMENSTDTYITF